MIIKHGKFILTTEEKTILKAAKKVLYFDCEVNIEGSCKNCPFNSPKNKKCYHEIVSNWLSVIISNADVINND